MEFRDNDDVDDILDPLPFVNDIFPPDIELPPTNRLPPTVKLLDIFPFPPLPCVTVIAFVVVVDIFPYIPPVEDTGSLNLDAVYYAQINSGGGIGTWTATTSLPAAVYWATSVVYAGYVYEIGGCGTLS